MMIVVMGVAGSGKTTIGRLLAEELGCAFHDGDDYHPDANVEKLSAGIPLSDEDRWPWLDRIRELIRALSPLSEHFVIACSALKQAYRAYLQKGADPLTWIYLKAQYSVLRDRLMRRKGHMMREGMLDSQFRTLEEPDGALTVDATQQPEAILRTIRDQLDL